jgi:nucleolar pre-ribosomal-associated protein 2
VLLIFINVTNSNLELHLDTSEKILTAKAILPKLADELQKATHGPDVGYTVTSILTIVKSKPFLVSQFGVDSVISALTAVASSTKLRDLREVGPLLYTKLCHITNFLLVLHRKYLGGRMHLFMPLLQILLTCLFTLHSDTKPSTVQKPPSWLSPHSSLLSGPHATLYSRILFSFSQPTVSSTSSSSHHRGNPLLTDETRKARQYAAQYVPYLLMHFCSLHLLGRMSAEVRKAVLPGIWACIEIVPRELLRGMNASMGRDERAVWASLWGEWCRVHGHSTE